MCRGSAWAGVVAAAVREYVGRHPGSSPAQAKAALLAPRLRAQLPDDLKAAAMAEISAAVTR